MAQSSNSVDRDFIVSLSRSQLQRGLFQSLLGVWCDLFSSDGGPTPAGSDDTRAFFGVGDGEGADGSSVSEGLGLGFVVVDGVGGGGDVDAG